MRRHPQPSRLRCFQLFLCLVACCIFAQAGEGGAPAAGTALSPGQVAVVVNDADLDSQEVGNYYLRARKIPAENLVHVNIPSHAPKLSESQFSQLRRTIEAQLQPDIQAIVLVWTTPYAVECNSITAALTLGYDAAQCRNTCAPGKSSAYFNSRSQQPYKDLGLRLSMLLPVQSVAQAKALIDRGVISGFRTLPSTAYFLISSDQPRSSRSRWYPKPGYIAPRQLSIEVLQANTLENKEDVMLYQVGLPIVTNLSTLEFLPGALADHLTSFGGDLQGQPGQMSSLRWLEAGATASYGTVSEPCNHWQKFPHPQVLLKSYLGGASAIEAYWKSVAWPAQGLFIGEPLAAPYRR